MDVRDLKLAIACGNESDEVKSLNKFFEDLFSGLTIYTMNDKPDLIFMKGDKFIMQQALENGYLWCRFVGFWLVLQDQYHCDNKEIQEIIRYKVEEAFKMGTLTPITGTIYIANAVEEAFKMGTLTHIS